MVKFGGILGFDNGIVLAPMGPDVANPELVAAVANSGGIGLLATPNSGYDTAVRAIRDVKKLTNKPFGAGVLLEFDTSQGIKAIFDEKLACLQVYWGDFPKEMVDEAHKHGVKVLHQIGSVKDAEKAIAAGVDCIIVQGVEAGGHIIGQVVLQALLPRVVDLVGDKNIAVVAAGSISDARGYVSALALGAHGICMGTRFIATKEAYANDYYKKQLLQYTEADTDRTDLYGRASWRAYVRCLNTPFHQKWRENNEVVNDNSQPVIGHTTIWWETSEMRRFDGRAPNPSTVGKYDEMCLLSGMGVGLVNDIPTVEELITRIVREAKSIIKNLNRKHLEEDGECEPAPHGPPGHQGPGPFGPGHHGPGPHHP